MGVSNNVVLVKGYISVDFRQMLEDMLKILLGKRIKIGRRSHVLEGLLRMLRDTVDLSKEVTAPGFPFLPSDPRGEYDILLRPFSQGTDDYAKDVERILARLADGWEVTEDDKQRVRSYIEEILSFVSGNTLLNEMQAESVQLN